MATAWMAEILTLKARDLSSLRLATTAASIRVIGLALTIALAAPVSIASAQDMPTVMPDNYVLSDILNKQRVDAAIGSRQGGESRQDHGGSSGRMTVGPTRATQVATTYRASPAVSARVRRQFSEWMGKQTSAQGGRRVAEALDRVDPVRNWAQIVGADGLRPGDAADALASYWVLNWVMANGGDSNRDQVMAVREQIRPTITSSPAYARLNEAQRQEFAEVLMLNFLMQHAAYTDALRQGDRDTQRRIGDAAVARFRSEMGVDLRRLRLTSQGFVRA